jgi:hypothetical protein
MTAKHPTVTIPSIITRYQAIMLCAALGLVCWSSLQEFPSTCAATWGQHVFFVASTTANINNKSQTIDYPQALWWLIEANQTRLGTDPVASVIITARRQPRRIRRTPSHSRSHDESWLRAGSAGFQTDHLVQ